MKKLRFFLFTIFAFSSIVIAPEWAFPNTNAPHSWHEYKWQICSWSNPLIPQCCVYSRTLSYNDSTCELTNTNERVIRVQTGECPPSFPSDWSTMGGTSYYPEDSEGNPLPSVGGCNNSSTYYSCSPVYQEVNDFSNNSLDLSEWWYFTSTGSDGNTYKCLASYKNQQGEVTHNIKSDYHLINPQNNESCLSESAFAALENTDCDEQSHAYNSGIYTEYDNPDSTYGCIDKNGDSLDDDSNVSCNVAALPKPEGTLGNPDELETGNADTSSSSPCGSPVWKVNIVNMNIYIVDLPLWYVPPIGPPVSIKLNYNSQSNLSDQTFGNKWLLNFESRLYINPDGSVAVLMPDGRLDVFRPDGQGTFSRPYGVFNTLIKVNDENYELHFLDGTVYIFNVPLTVYPNQIFLAEIKDAYGHQLTLLYNDDRLSEIVDAIGRITKVFDNDSDGMIDQIDDPFGRSALFKYDAEGNLIEITDMGGYKSTFTYDASSYVTSITKGGNTWTFTIEPADGNINVATPYPAPNDSMGENYRITITDPAGQKEEYFYFGPYAWYISPRDYITYESTESNNHISADKTYYFLTGSHQIGKMSKVLHSSGGYEIFSYDSSSGLPARISDYHGNDIKHSQDYLYNTNGLIVRIIDANGNILTYNYYPNDIDVREIKINLNSTPEDDNITLQTFTYNSAHDITSITDRMGNITDFEYNSFGQMISITQAKGTAVESTDQLVYDSQTHELIELKKNGQVVDRFTYDNAGRAQSYTDTRGIQLQYEYNNLNKVTKITYPDNRHDSITYSTCCPNLITNINSRSQLNIDYTYDPLQRLVHIQRPAGSIEYQYDPNSNLSRIIDVKGNQTSFDYDLDNRLVKKTFPDNTYIQFNYDSAGLMKKVITARAIEKEYTYDNNHNLIAINYSDDTPDITYTYDDFDRMQNLIDGTGTYQYEYDDISRLVSVDGPWSDDTLYYKYDAMNRLTEISLNQGTKMNYSYDSIGRLNTVMVGSDIHTYFYTGVNPLAYRLSRPNGSFTEYDYNDPLKRLTSVTTKISDNSIVHKYEYTYDDFDFIEHEIITGNSLTSSTPLKSSHFNFNNLNQLVNSTNPDHLFTYDNDGNMTQAYTPEGYVLNASYDAENRLISTSYTDSNDTVHMIEYIYSGNGLLAKVKQFENSTLKNTLRIIRSGFTPVQERDGNNQIQRKYVWGSDITGGIGGLLNLMQGGSNYTYLYDGRGNITSLLDSNESVVATYRYDPFGNLLDKTGTLEQPFLHSTKRYEYSTGLYYYGYRFYNPSISRWMTRDPLGESGGVNLYNFVSNNPINYIDAHGLWGEDVHSGINNSNYGTYKWAKDVGFTAKEAKIIAIANNAVDSGPGTSWLPLAGNQSRHFNQPYLFPNMVSETRDYWSKVELNRALKYANRGDLRAALAHIGKGLHSIQDKYAHRNWNTGILGMAAHPSWYDDWHDVRNSTAACNTEIATKNYIKNILPYLR